MEEGVDQSSIITQNKQKYLERIKLNGGYFQRFEWLPEEYQRKHEYERSEMISRKIKETNIHPLPFNPSQNKRLLKHEYPFNDSKDEKFVYGFLCIDDPYEATKDEKLRAKWMEEAKLLFGDFKPTGPQKPL